MHIDIICDRALELSSLWWFYVTPFISRHHPSIRNVGIRRYFEKFHRIFFMDRPTEKKLYHVQRKLHCMCLCAYNNCVTVCLGILLLMQALPRHLLLINWSDFTECLEVYSLLETLRQDIHRIPLYVSSCHAHTWQINQPPSVLLWITWCLLPV